MTITQIIGLIVVLVLALIAGIMIIRKSEKHDLVKWISLFVILSIALTWIFSYGYYNGAEYYDYGMNQQGLTDIPNLIYYAINFAGDKIIFLLALGAFYAVLSKCKGYKKLVNTVAEKFKGKEIIFALISSLLFTVMASVFSQSFIALIFVPFIISVALSMKLDKITAFCITFGSILIGTLGVTYGGEVLYCFNNYVNATVTTAILYRLLILVVAYVLFNFFTVYHVKKVLKDKNVNEKDADLFKVEEVDKKAKSWPIVVLFAITFILMVLGYVAWETNFGITAFSSFHTWLLDLKIGDFQVFKVILGTLAKDAPFGAWNLFHGSILLIVMSILVAIVSRVKLNDFISAYGEGMKKMSLPILLFVGTYLVMVAAYMSPFIPTITNTIFSGIDKFNPFLVSFDALVSNIFHVDFGFTGYVVATYFTNTYAANLEVIHTIFTTMYGFVGLFIPTSAILLIGLSYLKIDLKTWIKYIWIFIVAMLVILLVLFTIMTYI